jgi:hypothetical protein
LFFEDEIILSLAKEDGLFESLTAIFFLLASIFFFILFWKSRSGNNLRFFTTKRNIFYLLLFLVFFLGFGEEISWGQRIFNLKTPEIIKGINMQGEINIHNLNIFHGTDSGGKGKTGWAKWISIGRIFQIFWFCYCVIVPILSRYSITILTWLRRINLPTISVWLGIMFMANYLISRMVAMLNSDKMLHSIIEIKECNIAFLFLIVSLYFFRKRNINNPLSVR